MKIRVRRKRKGNRYYIDNEFLDGYAAKVGWKGHIVYSALCRHERKGKAFPGMRHLAEELGVSKNTVCKGVKELKDWNIIKIEKSKKNNRSQTYWLMDYSGWRDINKKGSWYNRPTISQQGQGVSPQEQYVSPQGQGVPNERQNNTNLTIPNNKLSLSPDGDGEFLSKKTSDPRIKEVMDFFYEACQNYKGFKPLISGAAAGRLIKGLLKNYSKDELTDEIVWFLESPESDRLSSTLCVALSVHVFNKWLAQREDF